MTKKQHYVPQFYLRNFTSDDNKLWVFDREKKEYYHSAPKDICFEKFLYETPWEDANPKLGKYVLENQIEDYFAEKEGEYSSLLRKIIGICKETKNRNGANLQCIRKRDAGKFYCQYVFKESLVAETDRVRYNHGRVEGE